jgi:hypothetical protein
MVTNIVLYFLMVLAFRDDTSSYTYNVFSVYYVSKACLLCRVEVDTFKGCSLCFVLYVLSWPVGGFKCLC